MNAQDAVAPREPPQREGQGHLQDPERTLLFRVARYAVLKADRTSSIPRRITAQLDSDGVGSRVMTMHTRPVRCYGGCTFGESDLVGEDDGEELRTRRWIQQ